MLIMGKMSVPQGSDLQKATYQFLDKLTTNDELPGLHIEPIKNSRDPKVRTGRVNDQYRAVLFRLDGDASRAYMFVGVWNHDDAIARAKNLELTINPVSGVSEIKYVESEPESVPAAPVTPAVKTLEQPLLLGHTSGELQQGLGIAPALADAAAQVTSEDELLTLVDSAVEWQGMALIELASGSSIEVVKQKLDLRAPETVEGRSEGEAIMEGLRTPAAQISWTYIESNDELRRVIDGGSLQAWRVFLHPEQRRYVDRTFNGPYRLSGGAGTGKTVVLIHRAARLAREDSAARVVLTTYTTNLAAELRRSLQQLDPDHARAAALGNPGIYVNGIDAIASAVIKTSGEDVVAQARQLVLGSATGEVTKRTTAQQAWRDAIDQAGADLPHQLRTWSFFDDEYLLVVLPQRITSEVEYLKVRRPGRGVRLGRAERESVWRVIESYRISARAEGRVDFREAAALAAACLDILAEQGQSRPCDHLLVDEGQDLTPAHWQLVRALVADGPDDVFIAEDAHQRIYGNKVSLGQYGLKILGRSRRLTLNYRTTAQNLAFGMQILEPGEYSDVTDENEGPVGYRSSRGGPEVELQAHPGLTAELDGAAELLRQWISRAEQDGIALETIAVLVRDKYERDRVVSGMGDRGVTVRAVDRDAVPSGAPVVMTMHRAKGTEFYQVLLFGVSAAAMPKSFHDYDFSEEAKTDALLRERSLLYVAATRARDQLVVSWNRESSPLLPSTSGS